MATALAGAKKKGIAVSIAIVDGGGHLILLERMEGGRFHTVHSATTKAVAAASNKRPTSLKGAAGQDLDVVNALGLALAAARALDSDRWRMPDLGEWRMHWRHRCCRRRLAVGLRSGRGRSRGHRREVGSIKLT